MFFIMGTHESIPGASAAILLFDIFDSGPFRSKWPLEYNTWKFS